MLLLMFGSGDRNRTCDTGLMSPLLYRLSYAAMLDSPCCNDIFYAIVVRHYNITTINRMQGGSG
jgi:hypothetical protein